MPLPHAEIWLVAAAPIAPAPAPAQRGEILNRALHLAELAQEDPALQRRLVVFVQVEHADLHDGRGREAMMRRRGGGGCT